MLSAVCGMVHIKEPLLLIGKNSPCGGSGFPLSLSEWSFTICLMPYNRKRNVLCVSLNKTFLPFLHFLPVCNFMQNFHNIKLTTDVLNDYLFDILLLVFCFLSALQISR